MTIKKWFQRDSFALGLFCLLAIITMYPVMMALDNQVLGWSGDNKQYVYIIGHTAEALSQGHSPFIDPRLNYPDQLSIAATDIPFLTIIASVPFTLLFNSTLSYNFIIFFSAVLSGYFTYLWLLELTQSRLSALIGGMAFLLIPYRVVHSYGHLQLISTQFIPLFFRTVHNILQKKSLTWYNLFTLSMVTFLVGASSQYYLMMCLLGTIVYGLLIQPYPSYYLKLGLWLGLALGLGAIISALPYLAVLGETTYIPYTLEETRLWSASPQDFFIPSRLHPLWGNWLEQIYPAIPKGRLIEQTLYLGTITLILAFISLFSYRNSNHKQKSRIWIGMVLFGLILALGTDLHHNGQPLQPDHPIWLPGYYLTRLPFTDLMRVWSRFTIIAMLFTSLLAGLGLFFLQQLAPKRAKLIAITSIGLLFLDLVPGRLESTTTQPTKVDIWLAQQPGDFAVAFLPPGIHNSTVILGSLWHKKKLPAYNHPKHKPVAFKNFALAMANFPDNTSLNTLHELNFRYIILRRPSFDGVNRPSWQEIESTIAHLPDVKVVAQLDDFVIITFR